MPRLTRSRARKADRDLPVSSDAEMDVEEEDPIQDIDEPEIVIDGDGDGEGDEEDELEDGKEDELEEDEQGEGSDASEPPGPSLPTRLRIKLKLPTQGSGASSAAPTATATPTPDGSTRKRYLQRVADSDIESEDEDSDDEGSTRSTSVATPGRPLTARQAVLRNVVDSSHVSLIEPPNPRKKKPLTEMEIALKREETARKRKNLSEKKLEDEKAETINRLLKKQSRARGKRNALSTAEDRPSLVASVSGLDVEEEADEGSSTPVFPTMYRWISTTRVPGTEKGAESKMLLSFSVPVSTLPKAVAPKTIEGAMDVDPPTSQIRQPRPMARCDVEGCDGLRKYRLVRDFQRGACGLAHLKHLEAQSGNS